jgi:hypothetical protein
MAPNPIEFMGFGDVQGSEPLSIYRGGLGVWGMGIPPSLPRDADLGRDANGDTLAT